MPKIHNLKQYFKIDIRFSIDIKYIFQFTKFENVFLNSVFLRMILRDVDEGGGGAHQMWQAVTGGERG